MIEARGNTALVDGLLFASAVDRRREAEMQAATIPIDAPEAWVCGPALGDLPRALLERQSLERLHVCILNREIWHALKKLDDRVWAEDPRVTLYWPGEANGLPQPVAVAPMELHFAEEDALPLRDHVLAFLHGPVNALLERMLTPGYDAQATMNGPLMARDPPVCEMFGTDNRPAIVVGGGPTVESSFDWIRERQVTHQIVTTSAALKPLLDAGIRPDVAVVIDRSPSSARYFPEDVETASGQIALVTLPQIYPAIPWGWKGPRYWAWPEDLFRGGSVLHAAVDVAVQRGAKQVTLIGADLCFPGDHSHVKGAAFDSPVNAKAALKTFDGFGRQVPTLECYAQFRRTLEVYVSVHPEVSFTKRDRRGVAISGVKWEEP